MSKEDKQERRERVKPEHDAGGSAAPRPLDVRVGKKSQLLTPQKPLYGGFYLLPR